MGNEKRDFHTNQTLTERVERLEQIMSERESLAIYRPLKSLDECETDHVIECRRGIHPDLDFNAAQEEYNRLKSEVLAPYNAGGKAPPPIDLLRELRAGFEAEASAHRMEQQQAVAAGLTLKASIAGPKAYVAETVVKKIDATLRDWA